MDKLCLCDWAKSPKHDSAIGRLIRFTHAEITEGDNELLARTAVELDEYFNGRRTMFGIPLYICGTEFQRRIWEILLTIPYGERITYKDVASAYGNEHSVRAVAGAIGHNGISVLIPCHRVVGRSGCLTGYAGGLRAKEILLNLEKNSCI